MFVTHDLEEAIALSDRVVIMSAGPAARIIGDWRVRTAAAARHRRGQAGACVPRTAPRNLEHAEGRSAEGLRPERRRVMSPLAPDLSSRCWSRSCRIALWHVLTTVPVGGKPLVPPFFFSTPLDVAARVVKWFVEGTIWRHLWITLTEATLAFVIGSVAGVLVGFWFARQPIVAAVLRSLREDDQRAAAHRAGADLHAVVRPRHLVQGRARRDARVLHRVLQRLSGRQGGLARPCSPTPACSA